MRQGLGSGLAAHVRYLLAVLKIQDGEVDHRLIYVNKNSSAFRELRYFEIPIKFHASCRDVDELRDCYTEWNKSEREKQILYINAYMWNIEKWYRWTYLQDKNRDTEVENGHVDTGEEGEGGTNWEIRIDVYTLPCIT